MITLTRDEYIELEESNIGICLVCGNRQDYCEPDAREYDCDECGLPKVYGVPELLIMGIIAIDE